MKAFNPLFMLPVAAITCPAYGIQYLSVEQAQQVLFAQATQFTENTIKLNSEQRDRIEEISDVRQRWKKQQAWKAYDGETFIGWFIVDKVIGKHEFITYATALSPQGEVLGIEIMDYRETYGGEVNEAFWKKQFIGTTKNSPLTLNEDIQNISGATLSCRNVTNGVKRLLALYEVVLK
ncbi:FMN-binding protein [Thiomicrorhabdus sp. ZW0627]|uniref:FMN-binding protein n=1 Tax=Thiomicrorhabdus sp. ZW0627 TaxID=3039774 RepID=UPI0024367783|nr:FMN-binding protein [Thiomicrorhabdus sp. ZW0627]MDG6773041.1 FMN-binding protein [Thiomicrorhabdus sp. ZW0627]